jgi:signal transduction histidine kinase
VEAEAEDLASEAAFFLPHVEDEPKQYEVDHRLRRKDGQTIWVHSTWTLLRDNEGKPIYLLGLLEDVTPLRERDEEIIQLGQLLDESVEKERENLARDLHDGPLQHQFGIIYHLQQIAQSQNDPELIEGLAEIREELEQVIGMLRMTSGLLRSPTLAHFGLIRGILAYIEQTQMNNPDLNIHAEISHEDGDLSTRVQQGIYRIFQHCLTNAIRHSQASNIVVRLWENDTRLNLEVEDDGAGFEVPPHWLELTKGGHYGLIGSAERAAALGGLLKIRSTPGAGTTVRVEIPLNEDAQKKQSLANLGAEIPRF